MALSLALTATPEGLRVRQYPPSLSVMRGETATLSCHFEVESLKYGVQWFKMKSEKQLIAKSARQSVVEKNSTSSLVITEVTPEDSGWYYCEVNVLQKEPEWGNGTELVVLGERQMFVLQKFMPGLYCLVGNYISFVSLLHQSLVWGSSIRAPVLDQHHKRNGPGWIYKKFKSREIPSEFIFLPEQFHDRSRNNHPGTTRRALYRSCPGNWNSPENKAGRDGQIIMWKSFMRKKRYLWIFLLMQS